MIKFTQVKPHLKLPLFYLLCFTQHLYAQIPESPVEVQKVPQSQIKKKVNYIFIGVGIGVHIPNLTSGLKEKIMILRSIMLMQKIGRQSLAWTVI